MSSFQLDADGDLQITKNSLTLTTSAEAIRQHLQIRFQIFLGEWFLDEDVGVPWFRDVLVKGPSFAVVQEVLKKVILETPGVVELQKFDFTFDATTRQASLNFSALTTEGVINFSQIVET